MGHCFTKAPPPMYARILKRELKLAFNQFHDDLGHFTDEAHSVIRSGHAGITQARSYGKDHETAAGAVAEVSNRGRGRTSKGIRSEVDDYFKLSSNTKISRDAKAGVYPHVDDAGVKHVQSVESDVMTTERQKSGVVQAQINDTLMDASIMKAGLYKKNAVIFQSDPHAKAKDQTAKKIVMHAGKKAFTSLKGATKALEESGLHGYAIVHRDTNGFNVSIDVPKQHSAHGNGLRALAVAFRRKYGLTGEHFNGNRTLLRANNVDAKATQRLAAKPEAASKYAELKTKYTKGA